MRVLVTGATGQLGAWVVRALRMRAQFVVAWASQRRRPIEGIAIEPVDLTDLDALARAFKSTHPQAVIHLAAMARPSECLKDPEGSRRINVDATANLASLCGSSGAKLVFTSTDMVFDGEKGDYRPRDKPSPVTEYGRQKAEGERLVQEVGGVVLRMSLLYGRALVGGPTLLEEQVEKLRAGESVLLFDDEFRTPLDLPTAAQALRRAIELAPGIYHCGGPQRLSRADMGRAIAEAAGAHGYQLSMVSRTSVLTDEPRPADVSLNTDDWDEHFPGIERPKPAEAIAKMVD